MCELVGKIRSGIQPYSLSIFFNGGLSMFKKIAKKILGKNISKSSSDGFFLDVRCNKCHEQFHLFINKSWELMQNFEENGSVTYALQKNIIGVGCSNKIHVNMQFDSGKNLKSKQIENGKFIEDQST